MLHFYDAAEPRNVPSGVYAAVYVNGFAWPESQIRRMSHVIRVSVHSDPGWARVARCIDIEPGAATLDALVPFIRRREEHGHHDATAYVNRSNWEEAHKLVREAGLHCRWWVATLDGNQNPEGPAAPWAVQYYGGMRAAYDLSVLKGVNDFSRA